MSAAAQLEPRIEVVFCAVYVFHAKMDGEMLGYRWPLYYTSVMTLDKMARNTSELVENLRNTYRFGYYELLRAYAQMQVFKHYADGSAEARRFASPDVETGIRVGEDEIRVLVRTPRWPSSENAFVNLEMLADIFEQRKTIFRTSVMTKPNRTVILGDLYPPPPWPVGMPDEAIFVAATPLVQILEGPEDLERAAKLIERVRGLAPETDRMIPLEKDGFWVELRRLAAEAFGEEKVAGMKPRVQVPGQENVITVGIAHFYPPEKEEQRRRRLEKALAKAKPAPPRWEVQVEKEKVAPYDVPPQPMGGFAAIQRELKYPEAARRDTIQGRVIVYVTVDEKGRLVGTRIIKSLRADCDSAAVAALRAIKWQPAMREGKPVKVSVAVPVVFRLAGIPERKKGKQPSAAERPAFVAYDYPPEPIGGFEAIQSKIPKEDLPCKGRVIVHVYVNPQGDVENVRILKGLGDPCDEMAVEAVRSVKWKPALQRDKPVGVWVAIPVIFKSKE